ncbi:hypothetical protein BC940DRAFT_310383 [Gongronella butleri]|nr:hypothetical protein BC940DRAFT_310383 [Gongronella butleri]
MSPSRLPDELLLHIVSMADQGTKLVCTRLCRSLAKTATRHLWKHPYLTHPGQVTRLFTSATAPSSDNSPQMVARSMSLASSSVSSLCSLFPEETRRPYEWITHLTISFDQFEPIPFDDILVILTDCCVNLVSLHMHNTYALFAPTLTQCHWHACVFVLPPGLDAPNWFELYLARHQTAGLPLTHLTILDAVFDERNGSLLVDTHLQTLATCCARLEHLVCNGFFTDMGIIPLAARSPRLQSIALYLPNNISQSNTISHASIDQLAHSCPRLVQVVCRGQSRINSDHAFRTLHATCPHFIYGDFSID